MKTISSFYLEQNVERLINSLICSLSFLSDKDIFELLREV